MTVDAAPLSPGERASGRRGGGYRDYWSPAAIATHITAAKALLAQYPALKGTQVFVNEYGPTYAVNVPADGRRLRLTPRPPGPIREC